MSNRLDAAIAAFDAANAQDPNQVTIEGRAVPRELAHARRLTAWVERLTQGQPSEILRLAARCQHLCRWAIPRSQFPDGRQGYLRWREELKKLHAEKAAAILRDVGYDPATIERLQTVVRKKNLATDPEVQTIEDALCLFFLEEQFTDLIHKERDKIVDIVRKTWVKMSPQAQQIALTLPLTAEEKAVVQAALTPS